MKRAVGALVTVAIAVAVIVGVGFGFGAQKYTPTAGTEVATPDGTIQYHGQTLVHVILHLNTFPDSCGMFSPSTQNSVSVPIHHSCNPSWPAYGPTNQFSIPAHAFVTVKWNQYDSGGALNNNYFAYPHGTVGPLIVDGKSVTHIPLDNVGHTFTMRPMPGVNGGNSLVSVASPADGANPTNSSPPQTVQFNFVSGAKGTYAWNCEFPCGSGIAGFGGVMNSYGFMSGYVHVT